METRQPIIQISQFYQPWTIPSSKTEAGQQHLVQLKSHNSNTEKYTVLLHYSVVKTKVSQKKTWPFIPCRPPVDFHPRPQAIADGTDTIAFIDG
jgi:hypothetical protein